MIEEELGSIMLACKTAFNVPTYLVNLKQNMAVPSLYFPPPISLGQDFTSHSTQKVIRLSVKVFDKNAQLAFSNAEMIADTIRAGRCVISLVTSAGVATGGKKFIENIEVRIIDDSQDSFAVAELALEWTSRYSYDEGVYEKIMNVYPTLG